MRPSNKKLRQLGVNLVQLVNAVQGDIAINSGSITLVQALTLVLS